MKKVKLTTPENIEVEYKLADLGSRAGAVIIDLTIQGLVLALLLGAVGLIFMAQDFWDAYFGWIMGAYLLVSMAVVYGYFIVMELNMNGRTPGKKILNLKTIRENGQPLTLKHSVIRNLFRIFVDMAGLGPLFIFFTKDHKRIGDIAASTIVVVEEKKKRPAALEFDFQETEQLKNYLSSKEYELLSNYFSRRDNLKNPTQLKSEFKSYLKEKYQATEAEEEIGKIIKEL